MNPSARTGKYWEGKESSGGLGTVPGDEGYWRGQAGRREKDESFEEEWDLLGQVYNGLLKKTHLYVLGKIRREYIVNTVQCR